MRSRVALFGIVGLSIAGYLVWHVGFAAILSAALAIGWPGFSLVCIYAFLVFTIRSIAFAVPNALGVHEAAYVVFAPVLGIGPEFGLAISLLKRAQNIAIGIPVLLLWQALEGHHAAAAARADN